MSARMTVPRPPSRHALAALSALSTDPPLWAYRIPGETAADRAARLSARDDMVREEIALRIGSIGGA